MFMQVVCNSALDLCAHQGLIDLGFAIYERMRQPDVITYNTLIAACADKRDVERALEVFDQMEPAQVLPTERTYGGGEPKP